MHFPVPASLHPSCSRQVIGLSVADQASTGSSTICTAPALLPNLLPPFPCCSRRRHPPLRPSTLLNCGTLLLPALSQPCQQPSRGFHMHRRRACMGTQRQSPSPQLAEGKRLGCFCSPYCPLHTGGLGDVPVSPCPAPHHASPHGSGSVTLDGTARKEKAPPVTLPSNQEEDAADSQVGEQHEEPDARGKGIQE